MNIKNKKNKANYVNFKANGVSKKILIPAGKTADIPSLLNESQIINSGDFLRGFFEVIEIKKTEEVVVKTTKTKVSKTKVSKKVEKEEVEEVEDAFEKIEKEVKDYTEQ